MLVENVYMSYVSKKVAYVVDFSPGWQNHVVFSKQKNLMDFEYFISQGKHHVKR
jgi:hypothetical protein